MMQDASAFLKQKLAIEKAGTYLESTTEIRNFQLARDEIRTFAGAILKIEIVSRKSSLLEKRNYFYDRKSRC